MNDDLDQLLKRDFLKVPEDFDRAMMARIHALPNPVIRAPARRLRITRQCLAGLALTGGAAVGVLQLVGFVFGIWLATSAH